MPAFGYNTLYQIQENVRRLYYRRMKISQLSMTYEEYIQTFVPQQARQLFRDVAPFTRPEHANHTFVLRDNIRATVFLYPSVGGVVTPVPPIPRDLAVQPDAPLEIRERINTWLERGGDASRDFGRVTKLLNVLNESYSRTMIRYYWPTIVAICSEQEGTQPIANELQQLKTPRSLKALPLGLQAACRLTAETIATTRLIPEEMEARNSGVLLSISAGQKYVEDELGTFYGLQ